MKFIYISLLLIGFITVRANAQTIPAGMPVMDESLRYLQLQGKLDPGASLMARPFYFTRSFTADSLMKLINPSAGFTTHSAPLFNQQGKFQWLPLGWDQQYNSHHPYGWNNSGMIDAKGYQTKISGGFWLSSGILSIQFRPELVYAQNPDFAYSQQYGAPTKGAYKKIFPGQSSIRLSKGGFSLGLSTENMWWGPGIQNSIIMSNNAPGFLHLSLNSTRPLKTSIGSFEFQVIFGRLKEDTSVLLENEDLTTFYYAEGQNGSIGNPPRVALDKENPRYFNGITLTYQPKWVKNLFIGLNRVAYVYDDSLRTSFGFMHDYLPVFTGVFRNGSSYHGVQFSNGGLKQLGSVFARYLFTKSHAELYVEYGYNDNTANLRDIQMSPDHSAAFTAGFKKLYPIKNHKWIDFGAELTQLAQSADNSIRNGGYWYLYSGGYTNQSRIIGSGFGMGSNMQTITVSLKDGFNQQGFLLQRLVHDPNPDHQGMSQQYATTSRNSNWEDLSIGFIYRKQLHRLSLDFLLQGIHSANYAWIPNQNVFNLHATAKLLYFL